jgi:branched-chain amino acid transport system permease protein
MFFYQLLAGLSVGCIYALVALGYSLIFASIRLLHFAQGDLLMMGGFFALSMVLGLKLGLYTGIVMVMVAVAVLGFFIERMAYRPIPQRMIAARIMATLGIGLILRNMAVIIWGPQPRGLPPQVFSGAPIKLPGMVIPPAYYLVLIISVSIMILLTLFLGKTKLGLAMRTTAHDQNLAELMGIETSRVMSLSFMIGAALAAAAGMLVAPVTFISQNMGFRLGIKGFAAAVLGGFGNIPGSMIGGLALGLLETFGGGFISSGYKDCIAFVVLILVLIFRPSGILGKFHVEKV